MTTPDDLIAGLRNLVGLTRVADLERAPEVGVDLTGLADDVDSLAQRLAPLVVEAERQQAALRPEDREAVMSRMGGPDDWFKWSPVIGRRNAIAPPFSFKPTDRGVLGRGRFGAAHCGPPGGTHGGMVAALLDEALGSACVVMNASGYTGTLSVRYERLTPIDADLIVEGWIDRVAGRKTFALGEVRDAAGMVTARADAVFVGAIS